MDKELEKVKELLEKNSPLYIFAKLRLEGITIEHDYELAPDEFVVQVGTNLYERIIKKCKELKEEVK